LSHQVTIKGAGESLVATLPQGEWGQVVDALLERLDEEQEFFRGARLALDVGNRELGAKELAELRDRLYARELNLSAVLSTSKASQEAAADLGLSLSVRPEKGALDYADLPLETELPGEKAILLQRTLRSGQVVRFPGHVVLLGDLNPGAEIVAAGHIIVWGHLRGTVHAGATGDEGAFVCALDLAPTQVRIAGKIAISPGQKAKPGPERARLREGQVVAEPWTDGQ
jgi:septum site-determining protein MinC